MRQRAGFAAVLTLIAFSVPLFASEFWVTLLTQIMIFGLLALSTDLLLGHAGLFSLCHASFFAVAAYATAILQVRHGIGTLAAAARTLEWPRWPLASLASARLQHKPAKTGVPALMSSRAIWAHAEALPLSARRGAA